MTSLDSLLDQIEEKQKVEGQIQLSTNATSLEFLQAIYRDPTQPIQRRMKAAGMALPFERPKLGVMVQVDGNDLADRLLRAIAASDKVMNSQSRQVIEHEPTPVAAASPTEPPDHSAPFAQNAKHRFRRL
jgi:hypothetical protein